MSETTTTEDKKFIELFNQIQQSLSSEVTEETPGYRLYHDIEEGTLEYETGLNQVVNLRQMQSKLFTVEVVEDLDVTDVTNDERYTIRIRNAASNVEFRYSLNKFRAQLLDYGFEPDIFIIDILRRIDGAKGNAELKELKDRILEYLSYAIHYKELFRYEYSTVGWDRATFDNKTRVFKYAEIISRMQETEDNYNVIQGRIKEKYNSLYETSGNSGDSKEWTKFTIDLMNNHTHDSLLFAVGISGLIRQVLTFTKETNLNINIMGQPGSGKSTIGHYILSFFGNPTLLEGASIDTENATEHIRAERPVLPYVLDERMLRFYGDSENKQKAEFLLAVFREYEGKEKERLGKQYENLAGQRVYGPVISSSVDCMLDMLIRVGKDLGQYRRFIEFNIGKAEDETLFNAAEALQAEDIANRCYGYGVRYIVNYMLYRFEQNDNYFINRFNEIKQDMKDRLADAQKVYNVNGLTSSNLRFALIVLSYQVLREALIFNSVGEADFDESTISDGNLLFDKTEEIISLLITNIIEKTNRIVTKNVRSLRDYLINVYTVGAEGVSKDNASWNVKDGDLIDISKTSEYIIVSFVETHHLERILLNKSIPSIEEILNIANKISAGEDWETIYKSLGAITDSKEVTKIAKENSYVIKKTTKDGIKIIRISVPLATIADSKEEEADNE